MKSRQKRRRSGKSADEEFVQSKKCKKSNKINHQKFQKEFFIQYFSVIGCPSTKCDFNFIIRQSFSASERELVEHRVNVQGPAKSIANHLLNE